MSSPTVVPCEFLPWDTEFFSLQVARVSGDRLGEEQARQIDQWADKNRVECLYFLARADDPVTVQTASRHGFELVDIRMTYECKAREPLAPAVSGLVGDSGIRPVEPGDLPALQALARALHGDTRFFSDPGFPKSRCEDFYSTWIALECQGRAKRVFVAASSANRPNGYISCHLAQGAGKIGLVGVGAEARGKGIGKSLLSAALAWFWSEGAHDVSVVTQGRNVSAQRLYQRCGFVTRDVQLWYHKWFPGVSDRRFHAS